MSVLCEEFKRKYRVVAVDDIIEVEEGEELTEVNTVAKLKEASKSDLNLGKHYMVFMAQRLTSEGRSMLFMVAKYWLASLTGH